MAATSPSLSNIGESSKSSEYVSFAIDCFVPSVVSVFTFGFFSIILAAGVTVSSVFSVVIPVFIYFVWEWFDIYGSRLTRAKKVFFDEKNILDTSEAFNFNLGPVLDDVTPGGTEVNSCCGKYPKVSLLVQMITDPQQAEMQEFYKKHYGNVYNTALRAAQEAKANLVPPSQTSSTTSTVSSMPSMQMTQCVTSPSNVSSTSASPTPKIPPKKPVLPHQSFQKLS